MKRQTLLVNGMHCNACTMLITEALEDAGVKSVSVVLDEKRQVGTVTLESSLSKAALRQIIEAEGAYTVS